MSPVTGNEAKETDSGYEQYPMRVGTCARSGFVRGAIVGVIFCVIANPDQGAAGRSVELTNARSPDGRYTIKVIQKPATKNAPNDIRYCVVDRKAGRIILSITSQYAGGVQPDSEDIEHDRDYEFRDAECAWVKWNAQTNLVALSEYPRHGYGHLFVIAIRGRTRASLLKPLPKKLIQCEPGERTQCNTRDDDPWIESRTLRFYCGGCGGNEIVVTIADDLSVKIVSIRPE